MKQMMKSKKGNVTMFKNLSLRLKIMLGSCSPLILVVILGTVCWFGIRSLLQSSNSVDHTHVVIEEAMHIEGAAVDMETGMRGYLLAGQDGFLEPYTNGKQRLATQLTGLKETVNDNPAQVQLLGEIQDNIDAWVTDVVEPTIELRRQIGDAETMDDMAKLVGDAKGKVYFDRFRGQVATFMGREEKLLAERQRAAADATAQNETYNKTISETSTWVEHTSKVIGAAKKIEAAGADMETGMRGYLLAGKEAFLEPYNNGGKTFSELIASLSQTVNDNPAQVTLLGEIRGNINAWKKDVTEPAITLRRDVASGTKTMDDIAALVGQAQGKTYFDRFRGQIATFVSREEKLMAEREKTAVDATAARDKNTELLKQTTQWVEHTHEVLAEAKKIEAAAVDMETGARGYLLAGKENFLDPYKNGSKTFSQLISSLSQTVNDNPEQVTLLGEVSQNIAAWQKDVIDPAIALRRQIGDSKTMNDMADLVAQAKGKVYFDKFRNQIKTFTERESALMTERQVQAESTADRATLTIVAGTLLTILLAAVISFLVSRSIVNPINRIITALTMGAEQVHSASGQVSSASQSLAEGATEQAAGLEETSSSLEEMSSMTKQNADNAQQANTLAGEARQSADSGTNAMQRMNTAIQDIQKSSDETSKIIKVIDEIAFQTNLLALNAAVEAARAGEAGKGFAVVAEEVRNLAMRSAEAAKNTSSLIEESVKNSNNGVDIANEVGKVLGEIVASVGKTTNLVGEIAAASQEQAQGIDQVNGAVTQMDKVTQQNAANAEESASAAEELSAQAEQMNQAVGELVSLVGGSASTGNQTQQSSGTGRPQGAVTSPTSGLGYNDRIFHKIAQAGSDSPVAVTAAPVHQAIPLDDDFNEFNG
jgi:methyl-accepting chemotaxis protein